MNEETTRKYHYEVYSKVTGQVYLADVGLNGNEIVTMELDNGDVVEFENKDSLGELFHPDYIPRLADGSKLSPSNKSVVIFPGEEGYGEGLSPNKEVELLSDEESDLEIDSSEIVEEIKEN